jgi:hypothetical protein
MLREGGEVKLSSIFRLFTFLMEWASVGGW